MKKKYEHAHIEIFLSENLDVICLSGGDLLTDGHGNIDGKGSDDIFF